MKTSAQVKRLQSATYVSEAIFEELVQGKADAEAILQRFVERGIRSDDIELIGDSLITTGERKQIDPEGKVEAFQQKRNVQRNAINRLTGAAAEGLLFYITETVLCSEFTGFWFILRTDDFDLIQSALRYLEDTGLGGKRRVGKGHFKLELEGDEFMLPGVDNPNCFVNLSRYIPNDKECDFGKQPLAYTLTTLRPKHESMLSGVGHRTYKKLIRVLEPGLIIPFTRRNEIYGSIVSVGKNAEKGGWEVYQNGMTIPVFAKLEEP